MDGEILIWSGAYVQLLTAVSGCMHCRSSTDDGLIVANGNASASKHYPAHYLPIHCQRESRARESGEALWTGDTDRSNVQANVYGSYRRDDGVRKVVGTLHAADFSSRSPPAARQAACAAAQRLGSYRQLCLHL